MVVNDSVEFYRLYNSLWDRDLMLCLCRDFTVIFAIFTKVCHVFCHDFLLSLQSKYNCVVSGLHLKIKHFSAVYQIL